MSQLTDKPLSFFALSGDSPLEIASEPIFVCAADGKIIDWNRGCEALYGYTKNEAVGQSGYALLRTELFISAAEQQQILNTEKKW